MIEAQPARNGHRETIYNERSGVAAALGGTGPLLGGGTGPAPIQTHGSMHSRAAANTKPRSVGHQQIPVIKLRGAS